MRSSSASSTQLASSDEPPYDTNGSVTPVSGSRRITPAMMMNAWNPSRVVRPVASRRSKPLAVCWAMRRPAPIISRKAISTAVAPSRPSSSPMAAKIMSLSTTGIFSGTPRLSPVPKMPPSAKANSACSIWNPLGLPHGSSQMSKRSCTWPNALNANLAAADEQQDAHGQVGGPLGRHPDQHHGTG